MDKYGYYKDVEGKGKRIFKHHKKLIIFITFLFISFFLIFFAFFGGSNLTGHIIGEGSKEDTENLLQITADLTSFDEKISIEGDMDQIEIRTDRTNSFFYAGEEKFDLKKMNVVITNYDGKISFDAENILKLKGKANEVLINGVLITHESDASMNVKFNDDVEYNFLKIGGVSFDLLSHTTSGIIKINPEKMIFEVNNEEVEIKSFQGDLKLEGSRFRLDGYVKRLNIVGESEVSID